MSINEHCTFPRLVYCRSCRGRHKVRCEYELTEIGVWHYQHYVRCKSRGANVIPRRHERTGNWMPV
jgi:hypothetical protein